MIHKVSILLLLFSCVCNALQPWWFFHPSSHLFGLRFHGPRWHPPLLPTGPPDPPTMSTVVSRGTPGLHTCESSNVITQAVCNAALSRVNKELNENGVSLSIDNNGVILKFDDSQDERIDTGHSCSVTMDLRHKHFAAHYRQGATIAVTGDILFKPLSVALKLPAHVHARVDLRKNFGVRFFGKCRRYARDSFKVHGSLDTVVDVIAGFSLKPQVDKLNNGDYQITIEPVAALLFELENTNLKLRVSGVSVLTRVWSFLKSRVSGFFGTIEDIFKGKKLKDVFQGVLHRIAFRYGSLVALNLNVLPGFVRDLIEDALLKYANRLADKRSKGMSEDMEDRLNAKLRSIFRVGSDGKRTIVIRKDIIDVLLTGTTNRAFTLNRRSLKKVTLVVRYRLPKGERDLDTRTMFLDENAGHFCNSANKYVHFKGNRNEFGGVEESIVHLGLAERHNKSSNTSEIGLHAGWHNRQGGAAIIETKLRRAGVDIPGSEMREIIWPGSQTGCASSRVATVRVHRLGVSHSFTLSLHN